MSSSSRLNQPLSGYSLWCDLMVQISEMALASAQVIAHRTQLMASASVKPSLADVREFGLMWSEKASAAKRAGQAVTQRDVVRSLLHGSNVYRRLAHSSRDALSLAQSRTPSQFIARYMQLLSSSGRTAAAIATAATATARSTEKVMAPYHSASTRNAARLRKANRKRS
jgi:hypothetical protein